MSKKNVRSLNVAGRRILIRADLNVPLDQSRQITDDRRIRMFLPTLQDVLVRSGRAIVMSHLGRPSGDPAADTEFSLQPVADRMSELLDQPVRFIANCIGAEVESAAAALRDGEVLLLENLRFHKAETIIDKAKKNPDGKLTAEQEQKRADFAAALAKLGDAYINDAFGTCHRKHVSMYDVPQKMSAGNRVVGFLVEKELRYLGEALQNPKRPFVAVLGGAKVSDKIGVIKNLLTKVDRILIGGAMTYTFHAAQGHEIGKSLCERDKIELAKELLSAGGDKLVLPDDSVCAAELKAGVATRVHGRDIPADQMGLDVGPQTRSKFRDILLTAGTIVWNGPVGAFETKPFETGTFEVAKTIAQATKGGAITIIGGGDSAAAIEEAGLADAVSHVSTGGGASLEFLEGKPFATIAILDDAG